MKIQLLPSTFDQQGRATQEQRLTCYLIDDCVAFDAGSIALATTDSQRDTVRDIIVTHPHLDHIATLPIYIDDLFGFLETPIRIHATQEVIDLLERDVFNWTVYPRFSELRNERGPVMEYVPFETGVEFQVAHLKVIAVNVNHVVPTDEIEAFTYRIARHIVANSPLSVSVIKEQLRTLAGAYAMTPSMFERVQGLRRVVYDSRDYQEGIEAFLEKRQPVFTGK